MGGSGGEWQGAVEHWQEEEAPPTRTPTSGRPAGQRRVKVRRAGGANEAAGRAARAQGAGLRLLAGSPSRSCLGPGRSWRRCTEAAGGGAGLLARVLPAMAFRRRAKSHSLFSQEFLIHNHADIGFFLVICVLIALMFEVSRRRECQASPPVASSCAPLGSLLLAVASPGTEGSSSPPNPGPHSVASALLPWVFAASSASPFPSLALVGARELRPLPPIRAAQAAPGYWRLVRSPEVPFLC